MPKMQALKFATIDMKAPHPRGCIAQNAIMDAAFALAQKS
jgi:hypothetical protein